MEAARSGGRPTPDPPGAEEVGGVVVWLVVPVDISETKEKNDGDRSEMIGTGGSSSQLTAQNWMVAWSTCPSAPASCPHGHHAAQRVSHLPLAVNLS